MRSDPETERTIAAGRARDLPLSDRRATGDDSVFYYRVHSPVVLLEFDHQGGIALNRGEGNVNGMHVPRRR